jgi:hypothetical protein
MFPASFAAGAWLHNISSTNQTQLSKTFHQMWRNKVFAKSIPENVAARVAAEPTLKGGIRGPA